MNARRTSTAVMARRVEPADSLDFFPTPPWATRAFCEHVLPAIEPGGDRDRGEFGSLLCSAWDPACGEGHMALAAGEYFDEVKASDIFDYGFGHVADFLHPDLDPPEVDWIITNPPFNLALPFIFRALDVARRGVAMLVRLQFLSTDGRYDDLFSINPPSLIAQYSERVPMHRGRWVIDGSTATDYCWLVWRSGSVAAETRFMWIPKTRRALARHGDWLNFSGCVDLDKKHPAMRAEAERVKAASSADARQNWELLL